MGTKKNGLKTAVVSLIVWGCCVPMPKAPPPEDAVDIKTEPRVEPVKEEGPPVAKVENVVDEHFGVKVDDPYRYMEDMDSPYVQQWFKGQAEHAKSVLSKVPGRAELFERLKELDKNKQFKIFSIRRGASGTVFYKKWTAGDNLPKLYVRDAKTNQERVLVDPEGLDSKGGHHFSIGGYTPSPDQKHVVYGLAQGGSEQTTYHIMEVATGKSIPETIGDVENAYNTPKWSDDSKGFFYSRRRRLPKDAPETEFFKRTMVYYHKLGTSQDKDRLIVKSGHSSRAEFSDVDFPSINVPKNSRFAVLKIKHGDSNPLTLFAAPKKSLLKDDIPWKKICDASHEVKYYNVVGNHIYLQTASGAERYKIVKTRLNAPDFEKARVVVPQGDYVIDNLASTKDALYVGIMDAGFTRVIRVPLKKPVLKILALPDQAAGYIVSASASLNNPLIAATNWTKGVKVYEYDAEKDSFTDAKLMPEGKFDNVPGYTSKAVKVKSHDGVMVPLTIVHPENIALDGKNPTLVRGYGSYGASSRPSFRATNLAWLEKGGILAIAHVRGGGENGKSWHLAGQKINKHNTWKDFIACVDYLIEKGYTTSERVAGQGGSAGGILIGRTITERPELLRAALIGVGSLDKIRSETTTNGVPNIQEFGTVKIEEEFKALHEMSSYHHVKKGTKYPAVLLTHGINDPRVEPWMSGKMTAKLQWADAGNRPIILRIDYDAGHGVGSTREQVLAKIADQWAFLLWQFDK